MNRRRKIFRTIRETAAVLAAAALLSSFLPNVLGKTARPDLQAAKNSCERVRAALLQYAADTGTYPDTTSTGARVSWLVGPGAVPGNFSVDGQDVVTLHEILGLSSLDTVAGYDGPYLQFGGSDIWGRSIVAHVAGFTSSERIWVLSAGPNGIIETGAADEEPCGDDIGVILEPTRGQ